MTGFGYNILGFGASGNVNTLSLTTHTGTGANIRIRTGFDAALYFILSRTTGNRKVITDSLTGIPYTVQSDETDYSAGFDFIKSFEADGYVAGTQLSSSSGEYITWAFREQIKFMDIVQYTGNGSARTISHGLDATPAYMIVMEVSDTYVSNGFSGIIYHAEMHASPQAYYMDYSSTAARVNSTTVWNNTAPTDSEFSVGTSSLTNASGTDYVAFLFAEGPNCDVGSFTSAGSTGNYNVTGTFRPRAALINIPTSGGGWALYDVVRGVTRQLTFPGNTAETTTSVMTFNADGFTVFTSITSALYNYILFR